MADTTLRKEEFWPLVISAKYGVCYTTVQSLVEGKHKNHLPVVFTATTEVRKVSTRSTAEIFKETLDLTRTILNNLNSNNWKMMACKMIGMKIESKEQLEKMAELIHQQALSRPDLSVEYAELCAILIDNPWFNKSLKELDVTLLQVLLPKCYDLFYTYKRKRNRPLSTGQNDLLLANSVFISELYNRGVVPESNYWNFVTDLLKENGNAQVHCLATMLKSAGTRLSKTFSLSRIVGHMLILENDSSRDEIMSPSLRSLIHQVKILHAKFWIHENPDRALKNYASSINENLIRPHKTQSEREEYELILMAECSIDDCSDLLSKFINRNGSGDVKGMLSPALDTLAKTDQLTFAIHVIVSALNERSPCITAEAGKLLANLVKARLLSKFVVYLGFKKLRENDAMYRNSMSGLEEYYTRQLNARLKV